MKTLNQKGITTSTILLIVAVIIIAGGLVWWSLSDNTDSSKNNNHNQNTDLDTSNWLTYNSANSDYVMFNKLEPAFQFKYPPEIHLTEDMQTVYLTEETHGSIQPEIGISWIDISDEVDDINTWCKDEAKFGRNWSDNRELISQKETYIDGIKSAMVKFKYSDVEGFLTEYICIPLGDKIFGISAIPYDSDLVNKYFNKVVETVEISD